MPEKTNNADNRIKQLFSGFSYACDTNENNLRRILRDNKDTEFGRRFGFADISSAEEFSKAVPARTIYLLHIQSETLYCHREPRAESRDFR